MRFRSFQIDVSDVEAAGKFYGKLLNMPGKPELPDHWIFKLENDTRLILCRPRKQDRPPQVQTGFGLEIDDFDAGVKIGEALQKEYEGIGEFNFSGIIGQAIFVVTDPDGNAIAFYRQGV